METTVLNIEKAEDLQKAVEAITASAATSKSVKVVIECTPKTITDRIKTLEDALNATGKTMPDFSSLPEDLHKRYKALFGIEVITEALNEGWKPNWGNSNEAKYYPYFRWSVSAGFGFYDASYGYSCASAGFGLRLCFKSDELATYAGKQFTDLYNDFMM